MTVFGPRFVTPLLIGTLLNPINSAMIATLAPPRSPLPCSSALPTATNNWLKTANEAISTRLTGQEWKNTRYSSGVRASQPSVAAPDPAHDSITRVGRSAGSSAREARKYGAAPGSPAAARTPASPGSTRSRVNAPTRLGPPTRATSTVATASAANAASRAATLPTSSPRTPVGRCTGADSAVMARSARSPAGPVRARRPTRTAPRRAGSAGFRRTPRRPRRPPVRRTAARVGVPRPGTSAAPRPVR